MCKYAFSNRCKYCIYMDSCQEALEDSKDIPYWEEKFNHIKQTMGLVKKEQNE